MVAIKGHPLDGKYTVHGIGVTVSVSPCSWMYKHYGFQIEYRAVDGSSWGHILRKNLGGIEVYRPSERFPHRGVVRQNA